MSAKNAKARVKSVVWRLPGVISVGIGLIGKGHLGVIVGVEEGEDSVRKALKESFPTESVDEFPISVVRYTTPRLAAAD